MIFKYFIFHVNETHTVFITFASGCKDEKICFILDESNVMDSSFLERMNTLLANGEVSSIDKKGFRGKSLCFVAVLKFFFYSLQVPGLFEGDEFTTLMTQCKEGAQREGLMLDSPDELYKWFTHQVTIKSPFKQS